MTNKILFVDEDPSICMLYSEEFSDIGYDIITCDNCSNIMTLIRENSPDLIVMDIEFRKKNRLDLLHIIKNNYPDLPVIVCTDNSSFRHDLNSIAVDYFVTKSSDLQDLKSIIHAVTSFQSGITQNKYNGEKSLNPIEQKKYCSN